MTALLRKESEALLPYWLAFLVLMLVNVTSVLWSGSFLGEALGERFSNGETNAVLLLVLSFLVGHGAVAHELRDGHVEFLDALPVGRAAIYAAKVVACALPCLALVLGSLAMDLSYAAVASPPHALSPLQPILVMHAMMLASAIGGLGLGMLLSWLGPLAWGVLGLAWFVAGCAGVVYRPIQGWVPALGSYGELAWDHGTASHPLCPPVAFALAGCAATVASGLLFLGPGQLLTERGSSAVAAVRYALGGCLGLALLPLGALMGLAVCFGYGGPLFRGVEVHRTEDFRVLYAPGDAEHALALAAEVDEVSRRVGVLVGNPAPLRLDVEVLGAPRNHLGVFTGGKIRLATSADAGVLAHELAHAHAWALSGPAGWDLHDHTHFFEEGLADWVGATLAGGPPVPLVAGAIRTTGQGRFEDLVDHDRYVARHDVRQSYVLGQVFVAALVEVAGAEAPGCVLGGLSRIPRGPVTGLALWYGLAARCGFDLDRVRDRWEELLDEAADALPPLPRLRATVVTEPALAVVVRDEIGRGFPLHCGFRDRPEAEPAHWVYLPADDDGQCEVPTGHLAGATFQYQVGYELPVDEGERGLTDVYLEWTDAAVP